MSPKASLKRRLALWAGFKNVPCSAPGSKCTGGDWRDPKGKRFYGTSNLPDFPHSLDICFKYLEPKLPYLSLENCSEGFTAEVSQDMKNKGKAYHKTPAMALCLAVVELIDKEVPNESS